MQKRESKIQIHGGGIYDKCGNKKRDTLFRCKQSLDNNQSTNDKSTNTINIEKANRLHANHQEIVQILDAIDEQTRALNEVQVRRATKPTEDHNKSHLDEYPSCRIGKRLSSGAKYSSSSTRKLQLDYYIKHNIKGGRDDCNCHFHYDSQGCNLLNECYGELCQLNEQRQEKILAAASECELAIEDHGSSIRCDNHSDNDIVYLAQTKFYQKTAISSKRQGLSLFIDDNNHHDDDLYLRPSRETLQIRARNYPNSAGHQSSEKRQSKDCHLADEHHQLASKCIIAENNNNHFVVHEDDKSFHRPVWHCDSDLVNWVRPIPLFESVNVDTAQEESDTDEEQGPVLEVGNALDGVSDSVCEPQFKPSPASPCHRQSDSDLASRHGKRHRYSTSNISILSESNLGRTSQLDYYEQQLDCSLTNESTVSLSRGSQLEFNSLTHCSVSLQDLNFDFVTEPVEGLQQLARQGQPIATTTRTDTRTTLADSINSSQGETNLSFALHRSCPGPGADPLSYFNDNSRASHPTKSCCCCLSHVATAYKLPLHEIDLDGCTSDKEMPQAENNASNSLANEPTGLNRGCGTGHRCGNSISESSNLSADSERTNLKEARHQRRSQTNRHSSSPTPGELVSNDERNTSSMRAVKEIAKMSAPSLSSLQYLPGQIDVTTKRLDSSGNKNDTRDSVRPNRDTNLEAVKGLKPAEQKTTNRVESREDMQHNDSCLLHRLCLCNCISRSHHVEQLGREPQTMSSDIRKQDNHIGSRATTNAEHSGSSPTECSSCGEFSGIKSGGINNKRPQSVVAMQQQESKHKKQEQTSAVEYEKQSPSFLGLLKPNKAQDSHLSARSRQSKGDSLKNGLCKPSGDLGSDGDLASSLSHELGSSRTNRSECLSPPPRARSTLSESLTGDGSDPTTSNSPLSSAKSVCSRSHKRATLSYKNLLSPSKLFASQASHPCDDYHEVGGTEKRKSPYERRSFLSKSLNRLSGKKRTKSHQHYRGHQATSRRACESPTISISNTSQQESLTDSINSLDEINLPHSLPAEINSSSTKSRLLVAPEIVLNKVEYLNSRDNISEHSAKSCDMSGSKYPYSCGRQSSSHTQHCHRTSPTGQGSEFTDFVSDNGSFQGPFSLPGSPRSTRRNRSPRLSQSPVPFRSPATESTKIEDGLKVCSTEHFEKHIGNIKENQIEVQKRLFTAWINHFCPNLIRRDLITELQDGIKLIGLLASLTHDKQLLARYEKLNRDKQSYINRIMITPSSRLKHLSNVSIAIEYLRKNLGMKLVNLNPMDIVSGKANVILGLCWSIILNFQLEQNFLRYSDTSSNYSSELSHCTSRLSNGVTSEDRARNIGQMVRGSPGLVEEYTSKDLLTARNRLLDHINKRFNLKLTNLTSNLVDGDVLLVIIKHLLPQTDEIESEIQKNSDGKLWKKMDDDEKLDHCFNLANQHLNVPCLFSASDLRQQSISENNSKPLLVYLSMLLSANPQKCSTEQMLELHQLDETLKDAETEATNESTIKANVNSLLDEIDTEDKFEVDKLQSTLATIKRLDEIIERQDVPGRLDENLISRHKKLKSEANQVDSLINWINQADKLFETTQRSSADLAKAIEQYQMFFSPINLPQMTVTLCPTLERQYRECLAVARQRVLSMEQTMKNWISYEQAREELKEWLMNAETKLVTALRPSHTPGREDDQSGNPIDQHMKRLEDLIEYFELEQVDVDDPDYSSLLSTYANGISTSSLGIEHSNSSLSGSLISLGSTSSRLSTLTCSKKATYHRMFDDFELKCRLLAAMLDSDQRDALLLGVKELKLRLKHITEHRVPQVVSELRFNINRCEMSIKEQDESSGHEDNSRSDDIRSNEDKLEATSCDIVSDDVVSDEGRETQNKGQVVKNESTKLSKRRRNKKKSRKENNGKVAITNELVKSSSDVSYTRLLWNKIVRASKFSLSFSIVLLLCLAGFYIVPWNNKDACCELNQAPIAPRFTASQRPI